MTEANAKLYADRLVGMMSSLALCASNCRHSGDYKPLELLEDGYRAALRKLLREVTR